MLLPSLSCIPVPIYQLTNTSLVEFNPVSPDPSIVVSPAVLDKSVQSLWVANISEEHVTLKPDQELGEGWVISEDDIEETACSLGN